MDEEIFHRATLPFSCAHYRASGEKLSRKSVGGSETIHKVIEKNFRLYLRRSIGKVDFIFARLNSLENGLPATRESTHPHLQVASFAWINASASSLLVFSVGGALYSFFRSYRPGCSLPRIFLLNYLSNYHSTKESKTIGKNRRSAPPSGMGKKQSQDELRKDEAFDILSWYMRSSASRRTRFKGMLFEAVAVPTERRRGRSR